MKTAVVSEFVSDIDVSSIRPRVADLERDDLEHILAYQRLLAGKNITRTIMRQSKDAIFFTTGDGRFVDVNQPLINLLGYDVEDIVGQCITSICGDPSAGELLQLEVEKKGYVIDYKISFYHKDGTELPCNVTSTVRWYNDESIPGNQPLFKHWVRRSK
ncbi:MAG: PAS domain-containing protein [Dehalococcoidia bacterium]|nr:PAS domain-containing protein [Dehalococcoidia bacterium]